MSFDSNVIKRQYGERPWHHFRLKANDNAFDSTAGLQDVLDSGERVPLPPGIFYSDQLDFSDGSKLIGANPFYKIQNTQPDNSAIHTIIRYNGAGGANTCLLNMSSKSTISTDASASNMVDVYLEGVTIDANGNTIAAGGGRNADGAATADIGIYMNRVGNLNIIARRFTVIGAKEVGLIAHAIYSGGIEDFGIMECLNKPCAIGYNYFGWTIAEDVIVHDMTIRRFDIRYCGDWNVTGGGGGGNLAGIAQVSHKNGAAIFMMGRNCHTTEFSYQRNGGMMVWGGASKAGFRGSEMSTLSHGYFERNVAVTAGSGSPDSAYALFIPYANADYGRTIHNCFFNGGNVTYPEQIMRIENAQYDNDGIEDTWTTVQSDSLHGPANRNDWLKIRDCGSRGGLGGNLKIVSRTRAYHADYEKGNYVFTSFEPYGKEEQVRGLHWRRDTASVTTPLTISSGAITISAPGWYVIDTEAAAATDNLTTINISGISADSEAHGWTIMLQQANSGRDITLVHNSSSSAKEIYLTTRDQAAGGGTPTNLTLNHVGSVIMLMFNADISGGRWIQMGGGRQV